jgi:hypothetical protein
MQQASELHSVILLDQQAKPSFVGFAAEEVYLNQVDQVQIFINGSVLSKHIYPVQRFHSTPNAEYRAPLAFNRTQNEGHSPAHGFFRQEVPHLP